MAVKNVLKQKMAADRILKEKPKVSRAGVLFSH